MTKRRLRAIVNEWQRRLRLQNWEITLHWGGLTDDYALIKVSADYENANLRFRQDFPGWTEEFANETVVHELLHIFERGVAQATESLEEVLEPTAYKLFAHRYSHEAENWVDRLSIILVDIAGLA